MRRADAYGASQKRQNKLMPYAWTKEHPSETELQLWPHQSLPPLGFAAVMIGGFGFAMIPLIGVLGTMILWGLLPFMLVALFGLWFALRRNEKDLRIQEVLTLTPDQTDGSGRLSAHLRAAFLSFGSSIMSPRECEIARLIIKGHSTKAIAYGP